MDGSEFHAILKKYLQGEATAEEKQLIDSWYQELDKETESITSKEEEDLENRYWQSLSPHIKSTKGKNRTALLWYSSGIAASIFIAIATGLYFMYSPTNMKYALSEEFQQVSSAWQVVHNTKEVAIVITLPDSSKITLEPSSGIKFLNDFNASQREVYLEGEAFFEVFHDAERPFLVYANEVTTKVLGTSFTIKAFHQEKRITVSVSTGKVCVLTGSTKTDLTSRNEIILTPNQQIVYNKDEKKVQRMIVEEPKAIIPADEFKLMRFEEAPVTEIFEAIERIYNVDIDYDEDKFSTCLLTTVISDGGLYKRLDIICNALGVDYSLIEDKIVINGAGCD